MASPEDIERSVPDGTDIVAIDEAQFFGPGLVPVVGRLADRGLVVIVAGLDVTFDGRPFEPLPALMALAEQVDKLTAICSLCGEEAVFHVASAGRRSGRTRSSRRTSAARRRTRPAAAVISGTADRRSGTEPGAQV